MIKDINEVSGKKKEKILVYKKYFNSQKILKLMKPTENPIS